MLRRGHIVAALVACALLTTARAGAAPPPTIEQLRAELARVREAQGNAIPAGAYESIAYTIDVAERIAGGRFQPQSESWRRRATRFLALADKGEDPIVAQHGKILMRGYRSRISRVRQGYAIYIPPDYDPAKRYPLMVMLHGGSANGNLFLGVVLGNNMNWKDYPIHLWDDYEPRWSPDWIVVAPDGFGQVMWRWMGEQDVLDVIDDVQHHYSVDEDRVVLGGLSNGGVGAYNIGMRHAWRFAAVEAIAGAPSWLQYSGGRMSEPQRTQMIPLSGMQLAENAINTDFRYYHGHEDGGPMKPRYVHELTAHISKLEVPFTEKWFDAGHDLLYRVHRHGRNYAKLAELRRNRRPKEVRVLTGDYRAARQHWVTVTRIADYPQLARVRAVADGGRIEVETENTSALSLDLRDAPLGTGDRVTLVVDGKEVHAGPRAHLGHVLHLTRDAGGWRTGFPREDPEALEKRPGSMGPIADAYYGSMIHVYGTGVEAHTKDLERAARKGAKGWPLWLWRVDQPVVADTEVTDAMMREHHLVLYGTPGSNSVLERIAGRLPVRVEPDAVVVGDRRIDADGVGVKLIHPNPLAPERYVVVQAAPTTAAVRAGNRLPDFLPDYVVYDKRSTRKRPRLVFTQANMPPALGYFDRHWRLPREHASGGSGPGDAPLQAADAGSASAAPDAGVLDAPDAGLPIPPAPPAPAAPKRFKAPWKSQSGKAARTIARRVQTFKNFRALTPGATWMVSRKARWSIDEDARCLERLQELGIRVRTWDDPLPNPVPTPVELIGRVDGIWFRMTHEERTLLISCEMAARLPELTRVLKRHGIRGVDVMSAYRDSPRSSFHTMGLALDLLRFFKLDDVLSVYYDYEETPDRETCAGPPPKKKRARILRDIACRLARSKRFSTVLTPNYNEGHRDHFHLDIRPDDPRIFLR
ncbi:MAG: extensin family protein [Myxococcales bacterium]|nr:extensin family protein [Myxococcales bacterium]